MKNQASRSITIPLTVLEPAVYEKCRNFTAEQLDDLANKLGRWAKQCRTQADVLRCQRDRLAVRTDHAFVGAVSRN